MRASVVVPTLNEERNLEACLSSVAGWAAEIVVIDSGSSDGTLAIAARYGARVVSHPFETHSRQWAWALAEVPLASDWVLGLDADQRVTPELRSTIDAFLAAPGDAAGAFVRRRQVFRGQWIRHGGYYPKYLLKLFRKDAVRIDVAELVDHHFPVAGPTVRLEADLVEENRNEDDIDVWLAKHVRYASLQALEDASRGEAATAGGRFFGSPDERTRLFKGVWRRLPLFVRPVLYFLYRYVLRLGFLDGRQGFVFHFLQGFWYRVLVDVKLDDQRRRGGTALAPADARRAEETTAVNG